MPDADRIAESPPSPDLAERVKQAYTSGKLDESQFASLLGQAAYERGRREGKEDQDKVNREERANLISWLALGVSILLGGGALAISIIALVMS